MHFIKLHDKNTYISTKNIEEIQYDDRQITVYYRSRGDYKIGNIICLDEPNENLIKDKIQKINRTFGFLRL